MSSVERLRDLAEVVKAGKVLSGKRVMGFPEKQLSVL